MIKNALRLMKKNKIFLYLFSTLLLVGSALTMSLTSTQEPISYASTVEIDSAKTAYDYYSVSLDKIIVNESPTGYAAKTGLDYDSVEDLMDDIEDASGLEGLGFFSFARWTTVTLLPVPSVGFANIGSLVTSGFVTLANIMFSIGAIILLIIGLLFLLVTNLDILASFTPTIDWFFSKLTLGWLFGASPGGTVDINDDLSPVFVAIGLMIVAIAVRLSPFGRKDGSLMGDLLISALAIAALMFVSNSSASNWDNSNTASVDQLTTDSGEIPISSRPPTDADGNAIIVDPGDFNNYTPGSFGWGINLVSDGVDQVTSLVAGFVSSITGVFTTMANGGGSSDSDCINYMNGMHNVATDILSAGAFGSLSTTTVSSIIEYDNLVYTVLYQPAAAASFGQNDSGSNTWCRMWESARGSNAVEQAYIAREGGMYTYALGSEDDDGLFIDADGYFVDDYDTITLDGFFGNNITTGKAAAAFKFFWAACEFDGDDLELSDDFDDTLGVPKSGDTAKYSSGKGDENSDETCEDYLTIDDGSDGYVFGAKNNNNDAMNKMSPLAYYLPNDNPVLSFLGFSATGDITEMLSPNPEALSFYKLVYGASSGFVWPAAVVAVVGVVMMSIGLLPMQLGALVLQVIAVLALMFFPIVLLILILPIRAGRRALFTVLKLFVASKFIQILFISFMAISIAVINLLNMAFGVFLDSSVLNISAFTGDGTPLGVFISSILSAVSIGLAFYGTKRLLKDVFKQDVTTIRGAMSVGQNMASSAINGASLRELGFGQLRGLGRGGGFSSFNVPQLGDRDDPEPQQPQISKSKEDSESIDQGKPNTNEIAADAAEAAGAAAGAIVGTQAASGSEPGKELEVPSGSTDGTGTGTVGDAMKAPVTDGSPNANNPEAPVPNEEMLSIEEKQEAEERLSAVQNAAGIEDADIQEESAARASEISTAENTLDYGLENNDEQAIQEGAAQLGSTAHTEGQPADEAVSEAGRRAYFDNEVDNSDEATERGSNRAGEMNLKGATLDRVQGDADGVGMVDNNHVQTSSDFPVLGSEFAAPGMAEDVATDRGSSFAGSEGLLRGDGPNSSDISAIMEGTFERFDALGRSIVDSNQATAEAIKDAANSQIKASEKQSEKLDNLTNAISQWFPNRNKK